MIWHSAEKKEVAEALDSQPKRGLGDMAAGLRLGDYGQNIRLTRRKRSRIMVFAGKLMAPVSTLLVVLSALSAWVNLTYYFTYREWDQVLVDNLAFSAVMLLSALTLDTVRARREISADSTIVSIKHTMSAFVRVRRSGIIKEIAAEDLVPGDIVYIGVGDIIPADGRLLVTNSFMCDESALTGDDTPVLKDADALLAEETPLENRSNMAYSGTVAVTGRAMMMVTETGRNTQMALKHGRRTRKVKSRTRMVKDAYQIRAFFIWLVFSLVLSVLTVLALGADIRTLAAWSETVSPAAVSSFVMQNVETIPHYLLREGQAPAQRFLFEGFMLFITLIVCTVPLGLPQNILRSLSKSIGSLGKEGIMMHRFRKTELIGGASVICTDKTGTLTRNEMKVAKAWPVGDTVSAVDEGFWSDELKYLMKSCVLCCNSKPTYDYDGREITLGDETETAIVDAYLRNGSELDGMEEQYPRCAEIPFDASRKLMTVIHEVNGIYMVVTKGAPEALLDRCTDADEDEINRHMEDFCQEGLRVIGVAVHALNRLPDEITPDAIENGLTFIGLIGLEDPCRPDVRKAVRACADAGIRTVMMTGDHPETAAALARQLGILDMDGRAVTGEELRGMTNSQLRANIGQYTVYARITPEDKVRVIRAWQSEGDCVLMTAGGMNDAPALHAADISCSVEATATDVAVDAADITLTESNYVNILSLIRQGRRIRGNLTKLAEYCVACSVAQTAMLLLGLVFFGVNIVNLLALIVLNLFLFIFVQPAFADEPAEKTVMRQMPDVKGGKLMGFFEKYRALLGGLTVAAESLLAYAVGNGAFHLNTAADSRRGVTMAFAAMALGIALHALCTRSNRPTFFTVPLRNYKMLLGVLAAAAVTAAMIMVPHVNAVFGFTALGAREWKELAVLLAIQLAVWEYPKIYARVKFE